MMGAENIANASGASFAMLFGVTSPKMSTMIATTIAFLLHDFMFSMMCGISTCGAFGPSDPRHGDGGNGGTVVAECFDKQNGGERRRTDVDDVVSHQNGRDELVVIIHELIGELCALVAVIGQVFEPDTVERRKRRFRGAEIGGQNDQNDQRYDQPCTVTVHLRKNNLSFLQKICRSHMPLGMYNNIVYYHNTRKKANRNL